MPQGIVHVVGGNNIRFAAFEGTSDAKKAHDVGIVRVEELPGFPFSSAFLSASAKCAYFISNERSIPRIRSINSDLVNLFRILSQILHMAENMSLPVLAHEIPQIGPQTHVRYSRLVISPSLDWEALEKNEAFAVKKLGADGGKEV